MGPPARFAIAAALLLVALSAGAATPPIVARELGKEEMARILRDVVDPTAPTADDSRHIEYVAGAFD